jgi:hypothetical protein
MNCKCEDGRFSVSASYVTIENPDSFTRSGTWVNRGMRSWRKQFSDWARCQKALGGIYFTKKWRAEALQHGLEFLKKSDPGLKEVSLKCISSLNGSFFGDEGLGFLEEGVKTNLLAVMSPLESPTFFRLHIDSLCRPLIGPGIRTLKSHRKDPFQIGSRWHR